eukprot:5322927-Amphidinium_carterae.1
MKTLVVSRRVLPAFCQSPVARALAPGLPMASILSSLPQMRTSSGFESTKRSRTEYRVSRPRAGPRSRLSGPPGRLLGPSSLGWWCQSLCLDQPPRPFCLVWGCRWYGWCSLAKP